jgi:glycogen phosphorylase
MKSLSNEPADNKDLKRFESLYDHHLVTDNLTVDATARPRERYEAIAAMIRDILAPQWVKTEETYNKKNAKRAYYLSMEFLIGRSLSNNLLNLKLQPEILEMVESRGLKWPEVEEQEPDPGLGNGGLGRLAACFLDSMASLALPAMGYGLRYEYGMFEQSIVNGWQQEKPANWLRHHDPWEMVRTNEFVEIKLNCSFGIRDETLQAIPGKASVLIGIPYDRPVVGYGGKTINTLRLWSAASPDFFDFQEFSSGDFVGAISATLVAESVTRVLYPDDSTSQGKALRFVQEYVLVACSLADIVRRFRKSNEDWKELPEKAAIQMNDTHPAMSVLELMRILLDEAQLGWDEAWEITQKSLAYTNHTLLPEALEKWPVEWFEKLLPRQLEIAYEINRRLMDMAREVYTGDNQRLQKVSVFEDFPVKLVRMANLAIVGSHSTNGVAAIHSELLKKTTVSELAGMFPERFNNKTNGVTPRRWLLMANPPLSGIITAAIGDGWVTDLSKVKELKSLANDASFRESVLMAKRQTKLQFVRWLDKNGYKHIDPESIFDCQVKRIHEYKRQLLNALRIVVLYNRLKSDPSMVIHPRTFFFAGKAAPAYRLAKLIIKFINNLSAVIETDPRIRRMLKVVFLPEYSTSLAEKIIAASDVSNQISTAGYEASGTSNMKFMMNGALTVGTYDGANVEMVEEAGEENFFMFGLTADEVSGSRSWYNPYWHYDHEAEIREALDLVFSDHFSSGEPGIFEPVRDVLLTHGDYYMHLADLKSYCDAHDRVNKIYRQPEEWAKRVILNIAGSGKFSSDRTILEYASEIWQVKPCPVS